MELLLCPALVLARTCSSSARGKLFFFASSLPSPAVSVLLLLGLLGQIWQGQASIWLAWEPLHISGCTGSTSGSPKLPNGRSVPILSVKGDLTFGWDRPCICQVLINTLCPRSTKVQILSLREFMKDKHTESSCSIGLGCSLQL